VQQRPRHLHFDQRELPPVPKKKMHTEHTQAHVVSQAEGGHGVTTEKNKKVRGRRRHNISFAKLGVL